MKRPAAMLPRRLAQIVWLISCLAGSAVLAQAPPPSRPAIPMRGFDLNPSAYPLNRDQKRNPKTTWTNPAVEVRPRPGVQWIPSEIDSTSYDIRPVGFIQLSNTTQEDGTNRPSPQVSPQPPPPLEVAPPTPPSPKQFLPPRSMDNRRVTVPLQNAKPNGQINLTGKNDRISLSARDAPVDQVLSLIAQQHGLNVVTADSVKGTISVTLTDVPLDSALDAVLKVNGYTWVRNGEIILVTPVSSGSTSVPSAQGRQLRIFTLNYLAAADADKIVKGLLSPVGRSVIVESSPTDKRRTREQLIVEDLPEYIDRVIESLAQTDMAPRQVLIEAYVLQISLKDDLRHGVDIQNILARVDNADVTIKTVGFANPDASPAFFLGIDGTDLDVLVEAIKQTTDAKTLASPKVLVINGQEARIQVGQQLGYFVTTTTQTTTMQQVDFLELGVVLRVTPQITESNEILMHIKPEVSDGRINAATGLPEEETTEVETTVILPDGQGMIIGGLIKEQDTENQSKIPLLGDLWVIGRLFQRRTVHRERNEIIIALVPRLVNCDYGHPVVPAPDANDAQQWTRATTPLVGPELQRVERRPLEPELPDAIRNPRSPDLSRTSELWKQIHEPYPHPVNFFFPSVDEHFNVMPRPLVYESPIFGAPEGSLPPPAYGPANGGAPSMPLWESPPGAPAVLPE